jgi:ribosomal protein L40E
MQTLYSILPSITENIKHEFEKHLCENYVCSQCGVTWQTDAAGLLKCDLGLPSHISLRQLKIISAFVMEI